MSDMDYLSRIKCWKKNCAFNLKDDKDAGRCNLKIIEITDDGECLANSVMLNDDST